MVGVDSAAFATGIISAFIRDRPARRGAVVNLVRLPIRKRSPPRMPSGDEFSAGEAGSNRRTDYGKPVPDLDCTVEISALLIWPLAVTSSRKLSVPSSPFNTCPDCDCVWAISLEF